MNAVGPSLGSLTVPVRFSCRAVAARPLFPISAAAGRSFFVASHSHCGTLGKNASKIYLRRQ
jgi:hypothetical protein